jgi:hypothetical protein
MELKRFDLLWRSGPAETCLHDGAELEVQEAALDVAGPQTERYVVDLARCPQCGQWQGPLPLVYEIMEDFGWDASDIGGFAVEGEPATAGLELGGAALPWAAFGEQMQGGQMQGVQEASGEPVPTGEDARSLGQSLKQTATTWEVAQAPATWIKQEIGEEAGEAVLGYVAVVHGLALARWTDMKAGAPFEAEELGALVRRAAEAPHPPAKPARPRQVRVREEALADALKSELSGLDIEVEVGETPLASEALGEITSMLLGHSAPPVFAEESEEEIRAFTETATRLYEREPWARTEGDRFLGVKVREDGDWFFANVMGQIEESPGLSLFGDWLSVCRFVHNQRSPFLALAEEFGLAEELGPLGEMAGFAPADPLEAAGGLEALSLSERDLLHPLDAERLDALSIDPPVQRGPVGGQYPLPIRFEAGEGPVAPRFSLEAYRRVTEALLLALERRSATPVTSIKTMLEIDGTEVSLRYPSDGTERPWTGSRGYLLLLEGHDEDLHSPSRIPKGEQVQIEAPARALYKDVAKALGEFHDQIYEATLRERGRAANPVCLWDDTASRRNPSPRVGDLSGLSQPGGLEVEIGGGAFGLRVEEALEEAPEEIQIGWASSG